ncbi:PREDICTED: uncharacterized protein LOC109157276 [Ipomoea nil]|uniref:uncharacterized protein LOC109157276 n=1 Tax=Ipomoea nil TaxID=35883 RepID=UPI000901199C|nr:PREDICTED: uncharacterized protein LOC109157276 [Ipomoea nil]
MHESQFSLVTGNDSVKVAWEILETTYEGTSSVKNSKLQLIQSEFEELRMNEDETIISFHGRVQELAIRAIVLGEPFSQPKLDKKILRSLPPQFRMKVTAIQEHDGWKNKSLAQLMGNLQTYEMEILVDHAKKKKNVAFTAEEQDAAFDPEEPAFTARAGERPEPGDVADSEGDEYSSTENFDLPALSYEVEYKKLYSKWEDLLKANRSSSSEVGILENARKVCKNQVADRDLFLKAASDREEKLK